MLRPKFGTLAYLVVSHVSRNIDVLRISLAKSFSSNFPACNNSKCQRILISVLKRRSFIGMPSGNSLPFELIKDHIHIPSVLSKCRAKGSLLHSYLGEAEELHVLTQIMRRTVLERVLVTEGLSRVLAWECKLDHLIVDLILLQNRVGKK